MKILHSADWHLDSPIQGRTEAQTVLLRTALLALPGKVAAVCKAEQCDMMLLAGDLFDGAYTAESYRALKQALEEAAVPVFITPGNHDCLSPDSPWLRETWPENVYIFKENRITAVPLPSLNCRVYGGAFTAPDSSGILEGFRVEDSDAYAIGILHGDPTQLRSPYCPITQQQVQDSGLDYLALGHIHKGSSFRAGKTLCLWPGCPMGRGFDELAEKGVQLVTIENKTVSTRFVPLDTPRFYDLEIAAAGDPVTAIGALLPPVGNDDFYRVTLTGESEPLDLDALEKNFPQFPNLTLRDRTEPPLDIWRNAGEDTLEGVYFEMLHRQLDDADRQTRERILLAARISRQILENREVKLP